MSAPGYQTPPAGPANNLDLSSSNAIQMAINNYALILVQLTSIIATQNARGRVTQEQVDSVVSAANAANVVAPKPTYTKDGNTVNWTEYQAFIAGQIEALRKAQIYLAGPFEVRSVGR